MLDALLVYPQTSPSRHRPEIEDDPGRSVPLGLLSVAAAVEAYGFTAAVLDARLYTAADALDLLKARLAEGVRWVGLSVMTCQVPHALELSRAAKALSGDVSVIWGGAHATLFPEQTVQHPDIDWVAIGEGEATFPKLLAGTPAREDELTGLAVGHGGDVLRGPQAPALDPVQFPVPAYHLLDIEAYLRRRLPGGAAARGIDVLTSRGCPYRCAFCPNTFLLGRRWRPLDLDGVSELLNLVSGMAGLDSIWFVDDYFFGAPRASLSGSERTAAGSGGKPISAPTSSVRARSMNRW
jgi:anaerobic magnesium-protoporphyrin IX monomethyl ester cyclase